MTLFRLIPLSLELSYFSSRTSLETRLSMADAIIYTTAQKNNAQLITSDVHFANLPGVTLLQEVARDALTRFAPADILNC
jgi:predicted nucleic acid-binding protein